MAEDFLEETYKIADAATSMEMLINTHRINSGKSNFIRWIQPPVQAFTIVSKILLEQYDMRGKRLWDSLQRLSTYGSFVPILDELEGECLPIVKEYIDEQPKIDVEDGSLRLRSSKYGFIYLSDVNNPDEPYNSRINPMREAYYIAKNIYHPAKYKYVFLGCGLGYIPYRLYLLAEGELELHIFFHDNKDYEYARKYGVLDWIPEEKLHVTVSENMQDFLVCATDNCDDYYFYKPDLQKYAEEDYNRVNIYAKSKDVEYSIRDAGKDNFYRNISQTQKFISEFDSTKISDKIIIVAGGPSVDDNIQFLKDAKQNGMSIISVGTVFKKLIAIDILPDVVTACDPFISVASQFTGVEITSVPLMLGLNTNWRVARAYKGDKYLVALDGVFDDALRYVEERNERIFPSAATVTAMAFNIAAYWKAKEIYLVGADFGFPGKMSHASGTAYNHDVSDEAIMLVEGVNGEVYSDAIMGAYREIMEEHIANNPDITVYNMSKSGARIKGTIER